MTDTTPRPAPADWIDPLFAEPVVEIDEHRADPQPHRYIHGRFEGTAARFSFYFPPPDQYEGRFFHNTYPMATSADIGPFPIEFEVATGDLAFTLDSGAAYIQTNNGGAFRDPAVDPAIAAWRVNAAAAKFARLMAAAIYGEHRTYGYLFGGSGGAYQTMGAAEATSGVWDGFLPFVPGCNHAIPSMFTVRMHALRLLRHAGVLPTIANALEPGGSGNPFAGLPEGAAAALREATAMGFPLRGWYDHAEMTSGYFANISGMIPALDPGYAEDFWTRPGYLGNDPADPVRRLRVRFETRVEAVDPGPPWRVILAEAPPDDMANAHLVLLDGEGAGASLPIARHDGHALSLIAHLDPRVAQLRPGTRVALDNSWALALETYHRHQVPDDPACIGWNQFRDASGAPVPPQRPVQVGPVGTANSAGSVLTGAISTKVLMLACLLDIDSFPWQAHWYRGAVERSLGARANEHFALQFIDNAHHENPMTPIQKAHAVSYGPALKQGLRDLARWVETGERPPETAYRLDGAQVIVPPTASARGGPQPVIQLAANGSARAEVRAGELVQFSAAVEAPPGAGRIVAAQWDFEGSGDFPQACDTFAPAEQVTLAATHAYATPGTRFAVLRAELHRDGDPLARHCRIANLARVRVVVVR